VLIINARVDILLCMKIMLSVNGTFESAFEKYVSQDQEKRFLRTNA
jgi:hypothetical protein